MKIGYCIGVYDYCHDGHVNLFKKVKKICRW